MLINSVCNLAQKRKKEAKIIYFDMVTVISMMTDLMEIK